VGDHAERLEHLLSHYRLGGAVLVGLIAAGLLVRWGLRRHRARRSPA
jgi:hypothetical protein